MSSGTNFFPFFFPLTFWIPEGVPIVFKGGGSTRVYHKSGLVKGLSTLNSFNLFWNFSLACCFWLGFLGIFFFFGLEGVKFGCAIVMRK